MSATVAMAAVVSTKRAKCRQAKAWLIRSKITTALSTGVVMKEKKLATSSLSELTASRQTEPNVKSEKLVRARRPARRGTGPLSP